MTEEVEKFTREQARSILKENLFGAYIGWDEEKNSPDTTNGRIVLDGEFTKVELLAVLQFF